MSEVKEIIYQITSGKNWEEYTDYGFIVGPENTDFKALRAEFFAQYGYPPSWPEIQQMADESDDPFDYEAAFDYFVVQRDAAWERAKADVPKDWAPQHHYLSNEEMFFAWLVNQKGFKLAENVVEVNLS